LVCENCKPEFEVLNARIEALEHRLKAYENAHTPSSKQRKKRLPPKEGGKIGAPEGHPGTTRAEPEPTMTVEPTKEQCDHCHAPLGIPFHIERRIVEEIPGPQPIEVTEYRFGHYRCDSCGHISVADLPLPEGRFGARTCAHVVLLRFSDRLPQRLVASALQRQFGLTLTSSTVLDITRRVADAGQPEYNRILALIRASPFVHCDETELRVGGRTYFVWIFTTPTETLYVIRPTRGKCVPQEILGDYEGVIISDGYKVYESFGSAQQRCWAHLLREMKELKENHDFAAPIYDQLKQMHQDLKGALNRSADERQQAHADFLLRMRQWLDLTLGYTELRKIAKMVGKSVTRWFTCLLHLGVPTTNNHAERQLRQIVVQRKIFGTLRNEKGTRILQTIMTLIESWKQKALDPFRMMQQIMAS
jgi:transposase